MTSARSFSLKIIGVIEMAAGAYIGAMFCAEGMTGLGGTLLAVSALALMVVAGAEPAQESPYDRC